MNGKKVALVTSLMLFGFCSAVFGQDAYQIKGKISKETSDSAYLYKMQNKKEILVQTTKINKKAFTFKGKVIGTEIFKVAIGKKRDRSIVLFVEKGTTTCDIKYGIDKPYISSINTEGGKAQELYNSYNQKFEGILEQTSPLYKELSNKEKVTDELKNSIRSKIDSLGQAANELSLKTVQDNKNNILAPYILLYEQSYKMDIKKLKELCSSLGEAAKQTTVGKDLVKYISDYERVSEGGQVQNFKMQTINGNEFDLATLKGKVFVIDFWASWCGPCRRENPNMVKLYNAFHDKGLEMVGVSLDRSKDAWKAAIEKDGLTWTHVSDLKYWDNEVAVKYFVNAVPTTILVDKEGKIIARGLHGEKLYKAVEALLQ